MSEVSFTIDHPNMFSLENRGGGRLKKWGEIAVFVPKVCKLYKMRQIHS